jgi:uncharacterized protein (UPF0210 family)
MIRSVTIGLPVGSQSPVTIEENVRALLDTVTKVIADAGLPAPRTMRYTLPAIGQDGETEGTILSTLRWIDKLATDTDIRWYCLPLDFVAEGPRRERLAVALGAVSRFPKMFLNLIVADEQKMVPDAINDVADLVLQISKKSNNGFDNFRVGASAGCQPNTPFFPFSRHEGEDTAFSFALETTDIALGITKALGKGAKIDVFRDQLIEQLTVAMRSAQQVGEEIAQRTGIAFRGIDASFAPFPDGETSVGLLIERLLGAPVGGSGSIYLTAMLTDCIRTALRLSGATAVGFNGVMYSLLEDEFLANANSRRNISLDTLISLSTVCGCGVDMVPIPGGSFKEEIAAVMLDVSALSLALKKPLGIRLLPIPAKSTNEFTQFNLDFLCDSRVMGLSANSQRLSTSAHAFSLLSPRLKDERRAEFQGDNDGQQA